MAESNGDADAKSYQTQWQFDSAAWLGRLDARSDQILTAIKELGDTYQYASLRFTAAVDFAQRLQELKSDRLGANSSALMDRSCQEYAHNIEELLEELAGALRRGVTQDPLDNYVRSVIADVESLSKSLLD